MREMKDSGNKWIGLIPKTWGVERIKTIFSERSELSEDGSETLLSVSEYYGVANRAEKVEDGEYVSRAESLVGYKKCYKGDLVSNIMLAWKGSMGVTELDGIVSPAYCVYKPSKSVYPRYYHYLFRTSLYTSIFRLYSKGIIDSRLRLYSPYFFDIKAIIPSYAEQQRIAEFLDRKCAEVDEMIGLQEQIIEELKAYKQSVITEAVTKGLNLDAPMRDSGIEWIGQIPEHWELKPLKFNFKRRSERNNPIVTTERLSLSIDKGVTLYSEKTTNLDRFKEDFTQYQIAHPNDIVLNCMNMIVGAVGLSKYLGCVSPVYYVIYPSNSKIDSEYYSYLLNTPTIRGVYYSYGKGIYAIERGEGRVNTCRLKVSYEDFGRFDIPIPPIEEQKDIVIYIKEKCADIDSLIQTKQSKIDSLKEYKKSIIYEYVTGKREVE